MYETLEWLIRSTAIVVGGAVVGVILAIYLTLGYTENAEASEPERTSYIVPFESTPPAIAGGATPQDLILGFVLYR